MDAKELRHLMPKNAEDRKAARELVALDPETLAPVVPEMLRHLKHVDSPVSEVFCQFFATHGERYVLHVLSFLARSTMPEVKEVLLSRVLPAWSKEAVSECAGALKMITTDSSFVHNDLLAMRLLARHELAEAAWLRQWLEFKRARLSDRSTTLELVAAEMQGGIH